MLTEHGDHRNFCHRVTLRAEGRGRKERSGWSGTPIWVDRKTNDSGRPIRIPSPFICVCGGLVPDLLGELAEDAVRADGFLDRIPFSYPEAPPFGRWTEAVISGEAKGVRKTAIFKLLSLELVPDSGERAGSRHAAHRPPRFSEGRPVVALALPVRNSRLRGTNHKEAGQSGRCHVMKPAPI
jgi:hypothetical protein